MNSFSFYVDMKVAPERVLSAYWHLEDWPEIAEHVVGIEMSYEDPVVQVLFMLVKTNGRVDRFQTVRILKDNTIYYFQPSPPPLLNHHHGKWIVEEIAEGSRVTSIHTVDVDEARATTFLKDTGGADGEDCCDAVERIISNNSRQTMLALKKKLESTTDAGEAQVA